MQTMVGKPYLALFLQRVEQLIEDKRKAGVSECLLLNSSILEAADEWGLDLRLLEETVKSAYGSEKWDRDVDILDSYPNIENMTAEHLSNYITAKYIKTGLEIITIHTWSPADDSTNDWFRLDELEEAVERFEFYKLSLGSARLSIDIYQNPSDRDNDICEEVYLLSYETHWEGDETS